jgi:type 1 fimbriae regulatory protein FimB
MVSRRPKNRRNTKGSRAARADDDDGFKDFLNPSEMDRLLEAAKDGRNGERDHLLFLMMYRHGLRVSEAIALRQEQVNLRKAKLWVRRLGNGLSGEHPIADDELRAIERYLARREDQLLLPWLFISERNQPLSRKSVFSLVGRVAARAGLSGVHPHTLRHSCGYYLASQGTDPSTMRKYLGHRNWRHNRLYRHAAAASQGLRK